MSASVGWYLRRASAMGPVELAGRTRAAVRARQWRSRMAEPFHPEWVCLSSREFHSTLDPAILTRIPHDARDRLLTTADRIMDGHAEFFGISRDDMASPDWSFDPKTGRHAPPDTYCFDIDHRDETAVGDIKQLWELSRHQYLTVLAAAFAVTGDDRYANRVADHLKSWWAANPPLRGVHWTSGIEIGIRLISWVWVRRLLNDWPGAPDLFERNSEALHQIHAHQRWLAAFPSIGSSANNHVIAEAAGQLVAACAFDWFDESATWRADAAGLLNVQLGRNTFDSGLNRELATEYHGLVLELGLAAALEAEVAGAPMPESTWLVLLRMTDALAAVVDARGRPPRQGDGDHGYGLVVDGEGADRWASLLATGQALFGRLPWWPAIERHDVRAIMLACLARPRPPVTTRPPNRPSQFPDAGMTILRTPREGSDEEIWCRCDGGPHGFLSIAAHAHADALSVEVRVGGVDILADPGTFCYHGDPEWRAYFRSTLAHNTLQLDSKNQSTSGGPFLWVRHARSRVQHAHTPEHGGGRWRAEHDGYRPATHVRLVELDHGCLRVVDEVSSTESHRSQLAYHLGPAVTGELHGNNVRLTWNSGGRVHHARLELPAQLSWSVHHGRMDPPLGWYSPGFGRKQPANSLLGTGVLGDGCTSLRTVLLIDPPPGERLSPS